MLELKADAMVRVRCGGVTLSEGRAGSTASRVAAPLRKAHLFHTFAMFEGRRNQHKDGTRDQHPAATIELVAILLLLAILYCIRLNDQLKRLKADGTSMRQLSPS
jgi:hypothetical protein